MEYTRTLVLQMMLWIGNQRYGKWLEDTFPKLKSFADQADEEFQKLGLPELYLLRLLARRNLQDIVLPQDPDDYARIGLYLPLVEPGLQSLMRQKLIGRGDANLPKIPKVEEGVDESVQSQVYTFEVNILDVPEALHWHRHKVVLDAAFRWWESLSTTDIRGVPTLTRDISILQEAVDVACMSQSELLRKHLGGRPRLSCNSVFLTNLFMYTREREAIRSWGVISDATFLTIHNQLLSQARTRSWSHVLRTILDEDPSIVNPFRLFKEG